MKAKEEVEGKSVELLTLLNRALLSQSYRKICKAQGSDYSVGSSAVSRVLILVIFLGMAMSVNRIFGVSLAHSTEIVIGVFAAWVALSMTVGVSATAIAFLLLSVWLIGAGAYLLIVGEASTLLFTHLLPVFVILGARWVGGSLRLAGHVPHFVPLALIIVLLPLLSEDPWRLAAEAGSRIALLAALSTVPLCYVLIRRIVRTDVEATFGQAAGRIEEEPSRFSSEATRFLLNEMRESGEVELARDQVQERIETAYGLMDSYLGRVVTLTVRAFRIRAIRRLLTMVIGISLAIWVLIYLLAYAAMPSSLAEQWSRHPVEHWKLSSLGFDLSLPLGPYVLVAALLATVACVGFLGFALTEDQYSEALWEAVLHRTAIDCLTFAVPYLVETDATGSSSS